MNRDEQESQLSAMFDGELPAAECELLSRRLTREENLRATWSRYAVIGDALRAEPVARVNPNFARRVSASLQGAPVAAASPVRHARQWRSAALGAGLAASVAGAAIMLLRSGLPPAAQDTLVVYSPTVTRAAALRAASIQDVNVAARPTLASVSSGNEPLSYVVPPRSTSTAARVPVSLANYVLAHSAVTMPLMRPNLVSTLVTDDSVAPIEAPPAAAGARDARAAPDVQP